MYRRVYLRVMKDVHNGVYLRVMRDVHNEARSIPGLLCTTRRVLSLFSHGERVLLRIYLPFSHG